MTSDGSRGSCVLLKIPGSAADHLFREGSAKASFWEVLFGSRLGGKKRALVSALPDGTRRFDIPVASIKSRLLDCARVWMATRTHGPEAEAAIAALDGGKVDVTLIGLQPQGVGVAEFELCLEGAEFARAAVPAFQHWLAADRSTLAEVLVPFGFTPH